MLLHTKIAQLPTRDIKGAMKVPVNGGRALTLKQIFGFLGETEDLQFYSTSVPSIDYANGIRQHLTLTADSALVVNTKSPEFILLKVSGNFNLDLTGFLLVNDFRRVSGQDAFYIIIQWNSDKLIFGFDLIGD